MPANSRCILAYVDYYQEPHACQLVVDESHSSYAIGNPMPDNSKICAIVVKSK